ncbi:MAG TPA: hypothetical protein VK104_07995 [Burkholderiaceae bacterium]|nr:hypothetical protein [Burkholderiaceae bacterium]
MTLLSQLFRLFVFLALGLLGMVMAMVFMVSTALAMAILFVVARIKGRPFGVRAYWAQRQAGRYGNGAAPGHHRYRDADVIDVEAREIP